MSLREGRISTAERPMNAVERPAVFTHCLEKKPIVPKQICYLACPGVPWDRSAAKWRDLRSLFFVSHTHSKALFSPCTVWHG
jgi:hypothetical protein